MGINTSSDFSTIPPDATANHHSVIEEFRAILPSLKDFPTAIEAGRVLLCRQTNPNSITMAGTEFCPDDMLYIALGDSGGADHREGQNLIDGLMIDHGANGNGQNLDNPLGVYSESIHWEIIPVWHTD